jgi:hypothetical protein
MAKAPLGVEDLNFEHMGDQELREVMARVKEALQARFTSRVQEFREFAREAGFTVTLHKIGKEEGRRSRRWRRRKIGAGASARNTTTRITRGNLGRPRQEAEMG